MMTAKQEKYQQVLSAAQQLCGKATDWVAYFREVLGIEGIVRQAFPNFDDLVEFEKSEEYATIQRILVKLREKKPAPNAEVEPTRVITVRLPKSMHEYLRTEAHDLRTSMNKLCISKLLQMVEQEMIPAEKTATTRRRAAAAPAAPAPQPIVSSLASRFATPAATSPQLSGSGSTTSSPITSRGSSPLGSSPLSSNGPLKTGF